MLIMILLKMNMLNKLKKILHSSLIYECIKKNKKILHD